MMENYKSIYSINYYVIAEDGGGYSDFYTPGGRALKEVERFAPGRRYYWNERPAWLMPWRKGEDDDEEYFRRRTREVAEKGKRLWLYMVMDTGRVRARAYYDGRGIKWYGGLDRFWQYKKLKPKEAAKAAENFSFPWEKFWEPA